MELTGGKQFDCVIIAGGEPTVFNDALSICCLLYTSRCV